MKRRNISMPDEIDEHLDTLPNASGYIVQLIRADIKNDKTLTKAEVMAIIESYCANRCGNIRPVDESLTGFLNL